jgi:sugar phosphate isomerase/epimerase
MKIACSSASFGRALSRGELTQLEWLDLCANELEVDGVVFDEAHFPRTDGEYLAQLKKLCADLGLTVAALAAHDLFGAQGGRSLEVAIALGAPLAIAAAPAASDDPGAWGAFAESVKLRARSAKQANVTIALRNLAQTLCASAADLQRLAKDVDSAWLRFALAPAGFSAADAGDALLSKAVIAIHPIADVEQFARTGDTSAAWLVQALARFRGFVVLERPEVDASERDAYHGALERFAALRANALVASAFVR